MCLINNAIGLMSASFQMWRHAVHEGNAYKEIARLTQKLAASRLYLILSCFTVWRGMLRRSQARCSLITVLSRCTRSERSSNVMICLGAWHSHMVRRRALQKLVECRTDAVACSSCVFHLVFRCWRLEHGRMCVLSKHADVFYRRSEWETLRKTIQSWLCVLRATRRFRCRSVRVFILADLCTRAECSCLMECWRNFISGARGQRIRLAHVRWIEMSLHSMLCSIRLQSCFRAFVFAMWIGRLERIRRLKSRSVAVLGDVLSSGRSSLLRARSFDLWCRYLAIFRRAREAVANRDRVHGSRQLLLACLSWRLSTSGWKATRDAVLQGFQRYCALDSLRCCNIVFLAWAQTLLERHFTFHTHHLGKRYETLRRCDAVSEKVLLDLTGFALMSLIWYSWNCVIAASREAKLISVTHQRFCALRQWASERNMADYKQACVGAVFQAWWRHLERESTLAFARHHRRTQVDALSRASEHWATGRNLDAAANAFTAWCVTSAALRGERRLAVLRDLCRSQVGRELLCALQTHFVAWLLAIAHQGLRAVTVNNAEVAFRAQGVLLVRIVLARWHGLCVLLRRAVRAEVEREVSMLTRRCLVAVDCIMFRICDQQALRCHFLSWVAGSRRRARNADVRYLRRHSCEVVSNIDRWVGVSFRDHRLRCAWTVWSLAGRALAAESRAVQLTSGCLRNGARSETLVDSAITAWAQEQVQFLLLCVLTSWAGIAASSARSKLSTSLCQMRSDVDVARSADRSLWLGQVDDMARRLQALLSADVQRSCFSAWRRAASLARAEEWSRQLGLRHTAELERYSSRVILAVRLTAAAAQLRGDWLSVHAVFAAWCCWAALPANGGADELSARRRACCLAAVEWALEKADGRPLARYEAQLAMTAWRAAADFSRWRQMSVALRVGARNHIAGGCDRVLQTRHCRELRLLGGRALLAWRAQLLERTSRDLSCPLLPARATRSLKSSIVGAWRETVLQRRCMRLQEDSSTMVVLLDTTSATIQDLRCRLLSMRIYGSARRRILEAWRLEVHELRAPLRASLAERMGSASSAAAAAAAVSVANGEDVGSRRGGPRRNAVCVKGAIVAREADDRSAAGGHGSGAFLASSDSQVLAPRLAITSGSSSPPRAMERAAAPRSHYAALPSPMAQPALTVAVAAGGLSSAAPPAPAPAPAPASEARRNSSAAGACAGVSTVAAASAPPCAAGRRRSSVVGTLR
eukprot:TRINITY_DN3326_c0_g1_i1.p1 TRINITY_DN3326_c0_g1~~TRINITY_DN3326_c0_g1_i1.p1  ORF type:complete len:1215 (-),score=145.55 TRINITY_DN3326_c0_g1_i1:47-3691(-)